MSKCYENTAKTSTIAVLRKTEFLGKTLTVFGTVATPLFLAKEVAELLEHTNSRMMLQSVDNDEKVVNNVYTLGGKQKCWFLTEYGLYEVLMQSRKPIAKEFKKGVKQILKEIRLTGSYKPKSNFQADLEKFIYYKGGVEIVAKLSEVSVATLQSVIDGTITPSDPEYIEILESLFKQRYWCLERLAYNDDSLTKMLYVALCSYDKKPQPQKISETKTAKTLPTATTPTVRKKQPSRKLHIVKQCEICGTDLILFADGNNTKWFLLGRLTPWFCRENTKIIKGAYLTRYISDKNKRQFNNPTPFSGGHKAWFVNSDGINELFLHYDKQGGLDLTLYKEGIAKILSE